ncbi:hypothetical protein H0H87_009695 [Tephrocybe sp. NHM501043]|nr:hypothetical protein H0H87_009695 [Tephrocybe sp. NHM501043]
MDIEDVTDVLSKTYDFVIAGGETAGLTVAARLSENPLITVAVLEAGNNTIDDPLTAIPARYGQYVGNTKYDWGFLTTKQYSNDRKMLWSRGKGLGGTSSTNFFAWSIPPAADADAFERLGNPGWDWDEFSLTRFQQPMDEQVGEFGRYDTCEGVSSGTVYTPRPSHMNPLDSLLQATLTNKGIKVLSDPYKGDVNGTWTASSTIDSKRWTRTSSATGYLLPAQHRPNLTVLTRALVSRVVFADNQDGNTLTATGVEFIYQGNKYILGASKEVVLSAGTIKDPQILELSGIGQPEVLSKINVEMKLELPGVGENLQEHNVAIVISGDPLDSPDIDPRYFEKGSDLEILVHGIKYMRGVAETEPMKSALVGQELLPGPQCMDDHAIRGRTCPSIGHA